MKKTLSILIAFSGLASAQLTVEQKREDFRYLSGLYSKQYAPAAWKKTAFGFDLLDIRAWLERVEKTKDDLEFYEICVEFVAGLRDTHDAYSLTSDFLANLNFSVDLYDDKVLIDSINRVRLPERDYPFQIGDEVVSLDGKDVESLIREFSRYAPQGNPRSTRRMASARITVRPQSRMPHAHETGAAAAVVIRRQSGALESYSIPWIKTGTPIRVGPVPSPKGGVAPRLAAPGSAAQAIEEAMAELPDYMRPWVETQYSAVDEPYGVLGYGGRAPLFNLPANFVQRMGRVPADFFYSGTYEAEGLRIGYIRIPNYGTLSPVVLSQFESEIAFFQANTDGLVVDEMRNTGGFLCFGENVAARLIPYTFRATGYEYRATWQRVNAFYNALNSARLQSAEQWVIDLYEVLFKELQRAYPLNGGRTEAVPVCTPSLDRAPATDSAGRVIAYTKPILMLIDEFSTSTADSVPAMFQDARRGILFGWRSNGAGGTNTSFPGAAYSEGATGMTLGLMTRKEPIVTPDYPTAPYIENIGVRPGIEADFMTKENLLQRGKPFVDGFTAAIAQHIRDSR
ncbi:MAG: PDZ domain-containing protein [Acidobacteria bacterium]|nr:PDZ domain-containing protein [Acidobacteriota bacterium]